MPGTIPHPMCPRRIPVTQDSHFAIHTRPNGAEERDEVSCLSFLSGG
jgi:hypothetical protein